MAFYLPPLPSGRPLGSGGRFMHQPENSIPGIITGQRVEENKRRAAWQMRRAMTPAERLLWQRLRGGGLGVHFRRQQIIAGFIVDFYCHSAALAVEVDGPVHEAESDAERDAERAAHGVQVVQFTNDEVVQRINDVLAVSGEKLKVEPVAEHGSFVST